jgi:hypothetical protein
LHPQLTEWLRRQAEAEWREASGSAILLSKTEVQYMSAPALRSMLPFTYCWFTEEGPQLSVPYRNGSCSALACGSKRFTTMSAQDNLIGSCLLKMGDKANSSGNSG